MPIKEIKYISDYKLMIVFSNGKKKIHDFKNFLFSTTSAWAVKYRNINLFKKAYLASDGTITWGNNEMDFNPYNLPK
jgi:hypothetical protein